MTEFIPYHPAMKSHIVHLLGDVPYKDVIWEWQFEKNPFKEGFEPVVVGQSGKIIGFNGVMPITVYYNGKEISGLWSCDFYVDGGYRGQGRGKVIKKELIRRSPLIMSLGISDMASRVLLKMGWVSSTEVYSYRRIRRPKTPKTFLIFLLQLWNRVIGIARRYDQGLNVDLGSGLPSRDSVNALWDRVRPTYTKIGVRNWEYLDCKFHQHPLAR